MGVKFVTIDLSERTHRELSALEADMGMTTGDTVAFAVRRLTQHLMGQDPATRLDAEETEWLEGDLN